MSTNRRDFIKGLLASVMVVTVLPKALVQAATDTPDAIIYHPALFVVSKNATMLRASMMHRGEMYDYAELYDCEYHAKQPRKCEALFRITAQAAFKRATHNPFLS